MNHNQLLELIKMIELEIELTLNMSFDRQEGLEVRLSFLKGIKAGLIKQLNVLIMERQNGTI